ncbi:hypothetical protein [Enterococcus phage vB_Efs8_KEN04]|uniref:Uncharacterized protein n=1 Tax=Enterococcus phage vB_Efs6_KEN16 TaxID=3138325 RepID=A0AAX4PT23_9CAUD
MEQLKGLTIRELIKKLEEVPEENKDLLSFDIIR